MVKPVLLGDVFHQLAKQYHDRPCLTIAPSGITKTYGELECQINRLAHGLNDRFPNGSDYIGIMLENSFAYIEMSYALKKINRIEVSINRAFRGAALSRTVNLTACDVLLTSSPHFHALSDIKDDLPHLKTLIVTDGYDQAKIIFPELDIITYEDVFSDNDSHIASPAKETDPAVIMFTSGTTGVSKGCLLSHKYAIRTAENMIAPFRITEHDINYTPYPLSHIGPAFYDILPSFMVGGRAIMRDGFSLSKFWPELVEFGVTWFMCLGSVQQLLYAAPETPLDRAHKVTRCWSTPAPVPKADFDARFGLHLIPGGGYGSTDAGWVVTPQWDHLGGVVLPHYEVAILDDDGQPVPHGTDGEMVIRGLEDGVTAAGYYGMPEKTAEAWQGDWFHTGDIGMLDQEGLFYFRYRKAERIRVRGEMVSGFEVEEGVLSHLSVEDAAAIAIPAPLGEEDIRVFVTIKSGHDINIDDLMDHCRKVMAKFMVPKIITIIDEMPRTPTGKPEKGKLSRYPI